MHTSMSWLSMEKVTMNCGTESKMARVIGRNRPRSHKIQMCWDFSGVLRLTAIIIYGIVLQSVDFSFFGTLLQDVWALDYLDLSRRIN